MICRRRSGALVGIEGVSSSSVLYANASCTQCSKHKLTIFLTSAGHIQERPMLNLFVLLNPVSVTRMGVACVQSASNSAASKCVAYEGPRLILI